MTEKPIVTKLFDSLYPTLVPAAISICRFSLEPVGSSIPASAGIQLICHAPVNGGGTRFEVVFEIMKLKQMKNKPITPTTHAIIDYAFGAIQIIAPSVMHLNPNVVKTYAQLGTGMLGVTAVTDTPVTPEPQISMETHKKVDTAFLVAQALMTFTPMIRKNKKALIFHLAMTAIGVANYFLTDYRTNPATSRLKVEKDPIEKAEDAVHEKLHKITS